MEWWWAWRWALVTLATIYLSPSHGDDGPTPVLEFISDTLINNVVADPHTGRLYVGAVNALYQLDSQLRVESRTETGPKRDNRLCTPPVTAACEEAVDTDNYNKLLLVHGAKDTLVVCGSVFRGICSLRNLSNIEQLLYFSDTKGEKSYVASAEESVSVVGVMSYFTSREGDNFTVFLVGKGYGSHDSTKLISTRILQDYGDWVVFDSIIEASAVQANPFVLRYLHDFRFAFKDNKFVYFLFSRTLGMQDTKNFTFISRMCEDDQSYYSYTELQLNCSATNKYNKAQVMIMSSQAAGDLFTFLFMVMSQLVEIIGKSIVTQYTCGAEFLPSPLASKAEFALATEPSLVRKGHVTSVSVAVETEHAVAFLGTATGEVLKVHLSAHPEVYGRAPGDVTGDRVNKNLLFDSSLQYLYITSEKKVPVQACHLKTDCHSCVSMKDPYCGWCVLEGRCTKKWECDRSTEDNTWLWSPNQQCVQIEAFSPPNLSCKKTQQVPDQEIKRVCVCVCVCVCVRVCAASCPQFESPEPVLIPVGHRIPISFQGKNLDIYMVRSIMFTIGTELMKYTEEEVTQGQGSEFNFRGYEVMVLYNCSTGREDCSLCKHADAKYQCVWCAVTHTCVYRKLCPSPEPAQCPNPTITDIIPRFGPLNGRISVTIKGSNLGIKREDVKKITVAGVDSRTANISVTGAGTTEKSLQHCRIVNRFQFQSIQPVKGPAAGGTVITIDGEDLDTATKDDVAVMVGDVPCQVLSFGSQITCMTGRYRGQKVPSELLTVTVKYGKNTTKDISAAYQYSDNPKIIEYNPKASFLWCVYCSLSKQHSSLSMLGIKFGNGQWKVGSVYYARKDEVPLAIIIPGVIVPMLLFIAISVYCYRRKSQQAEREYEKVKHQLENLEESVRDRCKKEFTDLMIEMGDHTSDLSEGRIPFLDYKTYTDRNFFLPSKDGANDVMITGKLKIPEGRRAIVAQALNQFSNLLNSKTFLINFIRTLESRPDFNARARGYFASLLTVALHGKLEYYTDIMRTLLLELMDEHVQNKNPKLMLRRSETVVERMLCNWMSICLYQFLRDTAGEPLYKLYKALKHQVEKGPVDAKMKKAKYTLNDTGLLGDDVEYSVLVSVLVHGEGPDVTPVKVLNCDTISQVSLLKNIPFSKHEVAFPPLSTEWRPGSTGQILSDLDLTSQKEGRWKRLNTLAHYNVRDNATLVLSRVLHTQQSFHQNQDSHEEKNALLEDDNTFHLVRPADEIDEVKSKRGSMKDKAMTKAITEIYLTRLLSVKGTLQQFVDDFFRSVLCSSAVVPPAVKYFFDFLDEQALRHDNVEEETLHIWKTNSLPLRFWVNILRNPHFIFDVHVTEVVDASLHVIAQTFMDACTKTEHKLSRESPSNKLLYAKEISTYKKMVDDYYKGIRQMVPVSDQDMNTHLAEVSRQHTDKLNTQVALHQLYQYASKYYDGIIQSLDDDPAAQSKQLTLRLQQIAAALEHKVTDL
uniref:Plexin b2a, tandem duplicate 1 n=1 Tax=Myripristis murdjan TaxID=586833 RepID=A0A667YXG2_9TELE